MAWKPSSRDTGIASFRYRVKAPLAALRSRGHSVELFDPSRSQDYDLVVFSKAYSLDDQKLAARLKAAGKRVVFDICDNHFYNPFDLPRYRQARSDQLKMLALCDQVVCSTPALADILVREARLERRPMVVGDIAELIDLPAKPAPAAGPVSLLWFGSHGSPNAPSGMNDLLLIGAHLREMAAHRDLELVVASNSSEKFAALAPQLPVPTRYVEWTLDRFAGLLAAADAVVIPLSQNPFVACKTHNRLTTALGAGVPVIADGIDSYREFAPFCFLDDWNKGMKALLDDPASARARAVAARPYIQERWSMERMAPRWEEALGLSRPVTAPILARQYQGAVDRPRLTRVTGWARMPAQPGLKLGVDLKCGGQVVASALANRARPDLAAVGFSDSNCGFELAVPQALRDGMAHRFEVVANGCWMVGEGEARFVEAAAEPAAQAVSAQEMHLPTPIAEVIAPLRNLVNQAAGAKLQSRLADELEQLCEAVEAVQRIAARIVLAVGEAPAVKSSPEIATQPEIERKPAPRPAIVVPKDKHRDPSIRPN